LIADLHVIGGYGFGYAAGGGASDAEEPSSNFLNGTYFGDGTVYFVIQIDR